METLSILLGLNVHYCEFVVVVSVVDELLTSGIAGAGGGAGATAGAGAATGTGTGTIT